MWFLVAQILALLLWVFAWPTMPLWLVFLPSIVGAVIFVVFGIMTILALVGILIGSFNK